MIKILDLFAGTQSVLKAIPNADYVPIDIKDYNGNFNWKVDLSADDALEELLILLRGWTPDVIWASPVCEKLSHAIVRPGGNYYFLVTSDGNLKVRKNHDDLKKTRNFQQMTTEKAIYESVKTLKMYENMRKIIDYFNVPFIIENPAKALSKYLLKDLKRSLATYCEYGFEYKKLTAFYSNVELDLKVCKHKFHESKVKDINTYAKRVAVPPDLIKEILKQLVLIRWNMRNLKKGVR